MDRLDRKLVAYLKQDSRASVTLLSSALGVSRGTVQARLTRLIDSGTIARFTIEMGSADSADAIHAVMLIEVQGNQIAPVITQLRKMPEITALHSTNGNWDLVARVETINLGDFDTVLNRVRDIRGILNSETCLLLSQSK